MFLGFITVFYVLPAYGIGYGNIGQSKTDQKFVWTKEAQTACETTKRELANVNTLTINQPKGGLILETDASGTGVGAVLLQAKDGVERPIAYYSKTSNNGKRTSDARKREMFALLQAVKYFRYS
jgi:hypothetical protein